MEIDNGEEEEKITYKVMAGYIGGPRECLDLEEKELFKNTKDIKEYINKEIINNL